MAKNGLRGKLKSFLADEIRAGRIRPGTQLPSRTVLAEQFGVGPHAVTFALKKLSAEDTVPLRFAPGKGVYLAEHKSGRKVLTVGLIGRFGGDPLGGLKSPTAKYYHGPILQNLVEVAGRHNCAFSAIPHTDKEPLDLDYIASFRANCLVGFQVEVRPETVQGLRQRGIPFVHAHRQSEAFTRTGVSYVDFNTPDVFRMSARLFHQHGHRRIAAIVEQPNDASWMLWRDALLLESALLEMRPLSQDYLRFLPPVFPPEDVPRELFRKELDALLDLPERPTAILCWMPEMWSGLVVEAANRRGLVLGRDLSVVGRIRAGLEAETPISAWSYDPARVGVGWSKRRWN